MRTSKPGKGDRMLLASRANPPRPLRDFSKSSNLTVRQLLLNSPLPSPALPALLPRHGKKPPPLQTRKILRLLLWLTVAISAYYLVSLLLSSSLHTTVRSPYQASSGKIFQISGDVDLPDYPIPFSLSDKKGRSRWTVSIPQYLDFPLAASSYVDICSHAEEVARHAGNHGIKHQHLHHADSHYIDVDEAQDQGLLPHEIHLARPGEEFSLPICERSLTYVLDASDAGFGSYLLGLWLSYTLAKQEHRAFFIDDSSFAYGRYNTYFKMPKKPSCRQPPKTQRVPCPQQAKHLVISPSTHAWIFGKSFTSKYNARQIFDMARAGYEALFQLRDDDAGYAEKRMASLKTSASSKVLGVHIRRGDRHPFEFAYSQGYLPPHIYKERAEAITASSKDSKIIIASDDPDIYVHGDLADYSRAQELITLASKKTNAQVSEGWEGGFFKDQFFGLGLPAEVYEQKRYGGPQPTKGKTEKSASKIQTETQVVRDYRTNPTDEARKLREFIGRAYLLELSILGKSDEVVCAISSYGCRIIAVMMGYEKAIEQRHWHNVDGKYDWMALNS